MSRQVEATEGQATGRLLPGKPETPRVRSATPVRATDRVALALSSTFSLVAHLVILGALCGLVLAGVDLTRVLLAVAAGASVEAVLLAIFVQRSANQQAARLEEAFTIIQHNTGDHLSEPLDVVVKDIRRELSETAALVSAMAATVERLTSGASHQEDGAERQADAVPSPNLDRQGAHPAWEPEARVDALVVDDDRAICDLVRDVLTETGYAIMTATTGERAMQILSSARPRLILADLDMPAMSGWALCSWLRAHDTLHDIPIILISASSQIAREATLLGAQGYIPKPFDIDYLLRVIDSHLLVA